MYLSKLEMVGFKSFGLKTDLEFTDGVTAIVGPNGCGKTNVVDAIRWVLGEQKTSMLRADSMDQVIFNGSRARKPLGMAEVSLTIENNKQILPTEYSQVVITRRLFRNGESQYLLNKTQCRLRDIVDLFMDTGMGSDAYSVIELKMIETILSDKADERRHLFEEAAGVTKYKARRKEAQRKLDAAQRDIARVQDIVREVQKTVNSLARQAEKARQHQDLSTRLRDLDRILFAFEYAEEFIALTQLLERITGIRQKREAAEAALTSAEQQVIVAEKTHEQMEQELRTAITFENDVRTALSEVQQRISLVDERKASAQRALERLDREQNESQSQQSSTSQELQ
nr:AAA family ATPase [Candidatus Kapabacteria bacterium]